VGPRTGLNGFGEAKNLSPDAIQTPGHHHIVFVRNKSQNFTQEFDIDFIS
jgi:hypothetical protein